MESGSGSKWIVLVSRNVCITVESKHFRCVYWQEMFNCFTELLNISCLRNLVPLIEAKPLCKHVVTKPHLQENV